MGMGKLLHCGWKSENTGTPEQQVGVGVLNTWSATDPLYQSDEDTSFICAFISLLMLEGLGWPLIHMTRQKKSSERNIMAEKCEAILISESLKEVFEKNIPIKLYTWNIFYTSFLVCNLTI